MILYINPDKFIQGVPARDLTQEEWDALTDEQKKIAISEKIYAEQEGE